ncbi:MAG: glycoside hydrolase family 15 protein, partial [Maribacter sp.]|nr:glycoside hydrolase family 15 protein [Maribacter sp.]
MDNLDYGIIGNCRSAALISKTGSLDWCCLPEFDSSSVFAKILDEKIGGSFEILVSDDYDIKQRYKKNTAVLITRFSDGENIFELHDFMPRYYKEDGGYYAPPEIARHVRHIQGRPKFSVKYNPKLEYASGITETYVKRNFIVSITRNEKFDTIFLYTSFNKNAVMEGREIELTQNGYFLVGYNEKILQPTSRKTYLDLERTKVYWLNWTNRTP